MNQLKILGDIKILDLTQYARAVGVYGEPFTIKIGENEIYSGSFWTPTLVDIDPRNDPRILLHFTLNGKCVQ